MPYPTATEWSWISVGIKTPRAAMSAWQVLSDYGFVKRDNTGHRIESNVRGNCLLRMQASTGSPTSRSRRRGAEPLPLTYSMIAGHRILL
jgi:hypothetical protein